MKASKTRNGKYRTQVVVGRDENGKRIVKSFTADTELEAIRLALNYKEDYAIGYAPSSMTVEQAFTVYIESRRNVLSPTTIYGYEAIKKSRLQSIMYKNIRKLSINDVQMAISLDAKRLSYKSVKSSVALLKSVLAAQDIDLNIARLKLPPKKKKAIEMPDCDKVLAAIIGTEIELPCLLAMWCSMRMSEVRGLQFRDISNDGSTITVQRTKLFVNGEDIVRDYTKTSDSTRTIYLPEYVYNLIKQIPHETDTEFIVKRTYPSIKKRYMTISKRAELNITFHQLRHEFATTLNDLGVPSNYIQKIGGWSTDNVMKTVYTHTRIPKELEYSNKVDSYFMGIITSIKSE